MQRKHCRARSLGLILLAALVAGTSVLPAARPALAADAPPAETKEQRDERMKWWREARFGMFIHWGLYAVLAGEYKGKRVGGIGEWIMETRRVSEGTRWLSLAYASGYDRLLYAPSMLA